LQHGENKNANPIFIYAVKITIVGICVDYVGIAFLMSNFSYLLFAK
jgi:hypothetical protein